MKIHLRTYHSIFPFILRRVIVLLFLLSFILPQQMLKGQGNNNKIIADSSDIETLVNDTSLSKTEKVTLITKIADLNKKSNPVKAILYYQTALRIAKHMQKRKLIIQLSLKLAQSDQDLCRYASADTLFKKISPIILDSNRQIIAEYYFLRATNYYKWTKYKLAAENFQKSRALYETMDDKPGQAKTLKDEARVWSNYNDYAKAIGMLQRSQDIYDQLGDRDGIASIQTQLGTIMESWGKLGRARYFYKSAFDFYHEKGDLFNSINNQLHLGDIEEREQHFAKAIHQFKAAESLIRKLHHDKLYSIALSNIGEVYYKLRKYDSALYYQELALPINKRVGDRRRLAISMYDLAQIYYQQNHLSSAIHYADTALSYAESIQAKDLEMNTLFLLSDINKARHYYRTAYDYLKLYVKVNGEIFNETNRKMVSEMEVRYEAEQKDLENERLRKADTMNQLRLTREKNQKILLIIFVTFILVIIIIISLFLYFRKKIQDKKNALIQAKANEIRKQQIKLKQLNNELFNSREQYRSIVENATIGLYQTTRDGTIRFANKTLLRLLGYTETELKKINLNQEKPHRNQFIRMLEEQEIITGREDIWTTADGRNIYVMESAWVIKDQSGHVMYYEGIVEDITKRKEAEERAEKTSQRLKLINTELRKRNIEYQKAKDQAEEANRAKTLFLANISHEIRTPLNSIIGYTELLKPLLKSHNQESFLQSIRTSSNNLLQLINDILDLSKIQANKLDLIWEPVSFSDILTEIYQIFYPLIEKKDLEFTTQLSPELDGLFLLDSTRFRQILFNLVGNAIKFTDKGHVHLTIELLSMDEPKQLFNIKIQIEDTGKGIPKEAQKGIFDAFKQVPGKDTRKNQGSGLGLNIAKRLIEIMGGTIELESKTGKGSTFTIYFNDIKRTGKASAGQDSTHNNNHPKTNDQQNSAKKTNRQQSRINPEIQQKFTRSFRLRWEQLYQSMMIDEIADFSKEVHAFSAKHHIKPMEKLAKNLATACRDFDIENIDFYLKQFKRYL